MTALTGNQFDRLTSRIYDRLGLRFGDGKQAFLEKRVHQRMQALALTDPQQYLFTLCHADPRGDEMQALANLITTNETYMFREYEQLMAFADHCLPEVLNRKAERGEHRLRLWSAGCASGEEPYTLAIILREVFPQVADWDCEIVATDIDQTVLQSAVRGLYGERAVRDVPPSYRARHLQPRGDRYQVRPATADLVRFAHLNLHDRAQMRSMRDFDFVFCRNVLIYFDDQSRKSVVDQFYAALNPGGYLFLGHAESVGRISAAFQLRRRGEHLVYGKD